jgi:Icc-related predicted phosphoesterase
MPRIQFISDLHGDFYDSKTPLKPFERCLDFSADYLAVAGDISNRYDVTVNLLKVGATPLRSPFAAKLCI